MQDLPENLRNKLKARRLKSSESPVEDAQAFLRRYWGDESRLDAIRDDMKKTIALSPNTIIRGIKAIEKLINEPPAEEVLLNLVIWDANHVLENPTEESAKAWLQSIVNFSKNVMSEYNSK